MMTIAVAIISVMMLASHQGALVPLWGSPCGNCGGQSCSGIGLALSTVVFVCQLLTNASYLYSLIHCQYCSLDMNSTTIRP